MANLSFVWSEKLEVDIVALSQHNTIPRDEILKKIMSDFDQAGKYESFTLPEIRLIEDKLFEQIEVIEKELGTR